MISQVQEVDQMIKMETEFIDYGSLFAYYQKHRHFPTKNPKEQSEEVDRILAFAKRKISEKGRTFGEEDQDNAHTFFHLWSYPQKRQDNVTPMIKLYFPIHQDNLVEQTCGLFNYVINEGMNFTSKISKHDRADLFIIRVQTQEDAKKIIDFYNTKYADGKHGELNPLIPRSGLVSVATDFGEYSYNSSMASAWDSYLDICYKHKRISKLGIKDFYAFLVSQGKVSRHYKHSKMINMLKDSVESILYGIDPLRQFDKPDFDFRPNYKMDETKKYGYRMTEHGREFYSSQNGVEEVLSPDSLEAYQLAHIVFYTKLCKRNGTKDTSLRTEHQYASLFSFVDYNLTSGKTCVEPQSFSQDTQDLMPQVLGAFAMSKMGVCLEEANLMRNAIINGKSIEVKKSITFTDTIKKSL